MKGFVEQALQVHVTVAQQTTKFIHSLLGLLFRSLSRSSFGTSFVVVIHQPKPEVAALFDQLILLTGNPGRVIYNGPMEGALNYYRDAGFPVPIHANPADHFIDMISPSNPCNSIDVFVQFYRDHCVSVIAAEVAAELASPGMTAAEVLKDKYASLEAIFGPLVVPKRTVSGDTAYMAPFRTQLAYVLKRTVILKLRSKSEIFIQGGSAVIKGVILGIAFLKINDQVPFAQVAFIFLLAQMEVIGMLQGISPTIDGRTVIERLFAYYQVDLRVTITHIFVFLSRQIMKYEVSDRLYRDVVFIVSMFVVDLILFLVFNLVYLCIAFGLSGLSWSYFGTFYVWQLLCLLAIQSKRLITLVRSIIAVS